MLNPLLLHYLTTTTALLARAPPTGRAMETARVPTAQTHGKGSVLDVEDDDGWLDEMLASGGGARVVAKGR